MPQVVYCGPFDLVDVPAHRIAGVRPGEPIEVSGEAAADLLDQDTWWPADSEEAREAARLAAETTARLKAEERAAAKAAKQADTAGTPAPTGTEA